MRGIHPHSPLEADHLKKPSHKNDTAVSIQAILAALQRCQAMVLRDPIDMLVLRVEVYVILHLAQPTNWMYSAGCSGHASGLPPPESASLHCHRRLQHSRGALLTQLQILTPQHTRILVGISVYDAVLGC